MHRTARRMGDPSAASPFRRSRPASARRRVAGGIKRDRVASEAGSSPPFRSQVCWRRRRERPVGVPEVHGDAAGQRQRMDPTTRSTPHPRSSRPRRAPAPCHSRDPPWLRTPPRIGPEMVQEWTLSDARRKARLAKPRRARRNSRCGCLSDLRVAARCRCSPENRKPHQLSADGASDFRVAGAGFEPATFGL
jgi:hypothetical protein